MEAASTFDAAFLAKPGDTVKDLGDFDTASAFPQIGTPVIAQIFLGIRAVPDGNLPTDF
jgi:hypothetical protein